jgi:hypothetical protein
MTTEVVERKKIGRPLGSQSAPKGLRMARWVSRHLGDEAAVPPSPLAARLLALAREEPDRFALFWDQAESQARSWTGRQAGSSATVGAGPPDANGESAADRRLRNLSLSMRQYGDLLHGVGWSWIDALPERFRLVGTAFRRQGSALRAVLTIGAPTFSPVPEGQPIPEWRPDNFSTWK